MKVVGKDIRMVAKMVDRMDRLRAEKLAVLKEHLKVVQMALLLVGWMELEMANLSAWS